MRAAFIVILILLCSSLSIAKEYGQYNPKQILTVSESPSGKKYGIDIEYLDLMINNLALHAKNYPPQFDTPRDKQQAVKDVTALSGMLGTLTKGPTPNPEILRRAGFLNSMGHNLDIPGSAEKAASDLQKLLSIAPTDSGGNYIYGTFLAGSGKAKEALPYLKQALASGEADASYALGTAYLFLGDEPKALENLEAYRQNNPDDASIARLLDGIRNGTVQRMTSGRPPAEDHQPPAGPEKLGQKSTSEAEKLLDSLDANGQVQQAIGRMVDLQIRQKPVLAPYKGVILKFFEKYINYETLRLELARMYTEAFTESELREINAFYATPTGKRLVAQNQEIMKKAGESGVRQVQAHRSELERMIQDEAERLKRASEDRPSPSAP